MKVTASNPFIAVDLFAGAGGMSQGAENAGIPVALAVECDPHAAQTYELNHLSTRMVSADVRKITIDHLPCSRDPAVRTLLFGGPPCQGFSYSNLRTRSPENPANWLLLEFLRIVAAWKPTWVVFENVRGILNTTSGLFIDTLRQRLEELDYGVACGVLNALDFGVPQNRARFFLVASARGDTFRLPTPRTSTPHTVADAISDLPYLKNGARRSRLAYRSNASSEYAASMRKGLSTSSNHLVSRNAPYVIERYKHIPPGGNWADIPHHLMENYHDPARCHTGIYHRLRADLPSVVIGNYRKNMLIHPTQNRGLSVREAARIQSFPDCYEFTGSIGFQQQQVADAVPPLLAQAVFAELVRQDASIK